jgi:hypothetical protein
MQDSLRTNSLSNFSHKAVSPAMLLQNVFEEQVKKGDFSDPLEALLLDEFVDLSRDFDATQIQDSWSWRNAHVARELAIMLVDEKGDLNRRTLFKAIKILENALFSLGPGRHHDGPRQQHLLKILKLFYEEKHFSYELKRINAPSGHQGMERLIRETLLLPEGTVMADSQARRAALSALFSSLRQNVGSCFATAPAILIQQDQPMNFLKDIGQLFGTGRLVRIYEGVEYAVPLSLSWGVGDLFRPMMQVSFGKDPLKTLASSPGLQAAFQAAGLIDKKATSQEKRAQCFELLQKNKALFREDEPFALISPDQMIKGTLLNAFGVTEKEIEDYRERSIQGPFAELILQAPLSQSGKSLASNRFVKAYDSAKSAFKALTDNALAKAWEFTLASLSESKADFAKWNLYISLGVNPEDKHGIGEGLYQVLQEKIDQVNHEINEIQSSYDHLFAQAKYLEGRMSRASTDREAGWIQAEYQVRRHEIQRALNERDTIYEKGRKLQGLYPVLIDFYGKKIRDYFQEVYDAEMHDVSANPYDDSPAGFRLMYKHGRSNTALWTLVNSATEYIQHLTSFFISTEVELSQLPPFEGLQKEIAELVTAAIQVIKRPEFLESSLVRLAKAYQERIVENPLQNLDKVKRKPWAYISGGTMSTLVSCYWSSPQKPHENKRWVESENELLAFLMDSIKELPLSIQNKYEKDPSLSMLAFSPTHAFLCKPGWELFRKGWESDTYTYTWIRDQWAALHLKFLDSLLLDTRMMEAIVSQLLLFIPLGYRPVVKNALKSFAFSMAPTEFREHVLKMLSYEKWLHSGRRLELIAEELDSILYRFLPLFPEHELKARLDQLFEAMDFIDEGLKKKLHSFFPMVEEQVGKYRILAAEDLREIAKALLILGTDATRSFIFFHQKITEVMQKLGLCYPAPLLFADTNWVKNVFGFVVNPGTRNIEFWRFDVCGGEGRPLSVWKHYLNGIRREEWGLYSAPHQYGN